MKVRFSWAVILFIFLASCNIEFIDKWDLKPIPNTIIFKEKLSEYHLFEGKMHKLNPANGVRIYFLSTPLFTDYAKKQRLIKLPPNSSIKAKGSGLPNFPEGTILAKTFFYFRDETNSKSERQILETRLLIYKDNKWNVAVYEWNDAQNEAFLMTEGKNKEVGWISKKGQYQSTNYHIPSNAECTTCHQSSGGVEPIGPKLRNLSVSLSTHEDSDNQLAYWTHIGWLEIENLERIDKLPNWQDVAYALPQRARAYLDVNCAHCHNPKGVASHRRLDLRYEVPLSQTHILEKKYHLVARMESNWADEKMPKLGTTMIHEEGLQLIKQYIKRL